MQISALDFDVTKELDDLFGVSSSDNEEEKADFTGGELSTMPKPTKLPDGDLDRSKARRLLENGYHLSLDSGLSEELSVVKENHWIVDEPKLIELLGTKCHGPILWKESTMIQWSLMYVTFYVFIKILFSFSIIMIS